MKIFTSYFGNLKNIDTTKYNPIAICLKPPYWFEGQNLKAIAPTYHTFILKDEFEYTLSFKEQLKQLEAKEIYSILQSLSDGKDVVLLCYEKPNDFCHRHLVAEWLNAELDLDIKELAKMKKELLSLF